MKITSRIIHFFCAFIPRYVNNHIVSSIYSFLGRLQQMSPARLLSTGKKRMLSDSYPAYLQNTAAYEKHLPEIRCANDYIENQNSYTDMSYGKSSIQASGCGIIAVYNAFRFLDRKRSLVELIIDFEKDGMVLNGIGGTAPKAIQRFLVRNGIENRFTCRPEDFHSLASESKCIILTMFNDKDDIRRRMHTICVTKENTDHGKNDKSFGAISYLAHNTAGNSPVIGPYPDFDTLINNINGGKAKIFFMIGITG